MLCYLNVTQFTVPPLCCINIALFYVALLMLDCFNVALFDLFDVALFYAALLTVVLLNFVIF